MPWWQWVVVGAGVWMALASLVTAVIAVILTGWRRGTRRRAEKLPDRDRRDMAA